MRPSLLLIAAALSAFAFKLTLAHHTAGTNDAVNLAEYLAKSRAEGAIPLIRDGIAYHHEPFAMPPMVLRLLSAWDWMAAHTGLPLRFWLRAACSAADLLSLLLVYKLFDPALPSLFVLALSPVSLFVSGFHGNTDPLHTALAVLSVYLAQRYRNPWLSGAALAGAMSIKIVPLIYIPALVLFFPGFRRKAAFLATLAGVFLAGCLPYVAEDPVLVLGRLAGYGSQFGFWGIPRLLTLLHGAIPPAKPLTLIYFALARFVVLAALAYFCWKYRNTAQSIGIRAAFAIFFFMTFTPGFGVQYLAWIAPWTVAAGFRATLAFHTLGGAFLFAVYTRWSGGLPWDFADAVARGMWQGGAIALELLTWGVVVAMWLAMRRRLEPSRA